MASREIDLVEENARLHGKVKALEYEVEMLTMLAKNIIYGNVFPGSSFEQQNDLSFGADVNDIFDESNIAADSSGNENLLNTFDFNLLGDDGYKRELKQSSEVEEVPKVEDRGQVLEEMRRLFGDEKGAEILSTETAMQLRFNQKCDATGARLWPALPFNLGH